MFDIKIEILISNGKELQWSFESVWLGFGKPLRLKATGFSKLQLNLKKLSTSFFSVSFYVALWCLIEPCFTIFSRQTRPSSLTPVRQTTATDNQIRTQIRPLHPNTQQTIIRSDHQIRPSDHTTTANTRPPVQNTPPDHRTPSLTTQLPIRTANPTSWNGTCQVHSLWVGSRGVYRALDEPCKAYFPHTFGLKFPDFFPA